MDIKGFERLFSEGISLELMGKVKDILDENDLDIGELVARVSHMKDGQSVYDILLEMIPEEKHEAFLLSFANAWRSTRSGASVDDDEDNDTEDDEDDDEDEDDPVMKVPYSRKDAYQYILNFISMHYMQHPDLFDENALVKCCRKCQKSPTGGKGSDPKCKGYGKCSDFEATNIQFWHEKAELCLRVGEKATFFMMMSAKIYTYFADSKTRFLFDDEEKKS
jgi:hypothetical protein